MSDVFLVRHGIAAERELYEQDEERPLTKEGDRKTRKVARRLQELGLKFDVILTSPLVRASQTAEILRDEGLSSDVQEFLPLAPEGNLQAWIDWYQSWNPTAEKTVALVGHQPDLGNWAEQLIWGEVRDALIVKKAGVLGLSVPDSGLILGSSQLFLLTPPKFLLN